MIDQIVHIISIMVISHFAVGWQLSSLAPIYTQTISFENTVFLYSCLIIVAVWAVPILEVELATAIMSKKAPADKELVPIERSDRVMGAVERLLSVVLIVMSKGLFIPLVFLPRLYFLLHQDSSPNKIAAYSKMGTSFVTALVICFPILFIPPFLN